MTADLWVCLFLILLGVGFNLLVKLATLEEEGRSMTPWAYVSSHPYRSLLLAVSTILCALLLHFVGQLNYSTALLLGIASDQAADRMRARAGTRMDQGLDRVGQP